MLVVRLVEDRLGRTRAVADPMHGLSASSITLGVLHRGDPHWVWLYCTNHFVNCHHSRAVAVAPYVIRWGPEVSSGVLRTRMRCLECGHRGAQVITPSYIDRRIGGAPFA